MFRDELPGVEIYAKAEMFNPGGSIKDRPVRRMLVEAVVSGDLRPGKTILDSSSGNAGIAYAWIGRVLGYPVELVIPENASVERKKRIKAHGATIVFTDPSEGYDEALREVHRRAGSSPDRYFFCDQYANDNNWRAHYDTTAVEILEQTGGRLTHFVAGVGTGGTLTGTGRRLKAYNPAIEVHAVIPERFPGVEGLKPLGQPEDIVPKILDERLITRRWPVSIEDSYTMCMRLAAAGLFTGQSSGAYMQGVYELAKTIREGVIVTVLNDIGERYFSTYLWD
jgi:cysteine synthase B